MKTDKRLEGDILLALHKEEDLGATKGVHIDIIHAYTNDTEGNENYTIQKVRKALNKLMREGIVVAGWKKGLHYSIYKEKETEE